MGMAYARDEVRELIEAREKAERDEISRLHHARQEGLQEGLRLAALGMASAGLGREQIATALGLTEQQLDAWLS